MTPQSINNLLTCKKLNFQLYYVLMRTYFPFRLFEAEDRDCTSFDREKIADISSVLNEKHCIL